MKAIVEKIHYNFSFFYIYNLIFHYYVTTKT